MRESSSRASPFWSRPSKKWSTFNLSGTGASGSGSVSATAASLAFLISDRNSLHENPSSGISNSHCCYNRSFKIPAPVPTDWGLWPPRPDEQGCHVRAEVDSRGERLERSRRNPYSNREALGYGAL